MRSIVNSCPFQRKINSEESFHVNSFYDSQHNLFLTVATRLSQCVSFRLRLVVLNLCFMIWYFSLRRYPRLFPSKRGRSGTVELCFVRVLVSTLRTQRKLSWDKARLSCSILCACSHRNSHFFRNVPKFSLWAYLANINLKYWFDPL